MSPTGALTGMTQLFIVLGIMIAFFVNYGSLLHSKGTVQYVVPLALQALPAVILFFGMLISSETPRWLARNDRLEEATRVLSRIRQLPTTHPYVQEELQEMSDQLAWERQLIGGSKLKDLIQEMFTIAGNRKRALISIGLMICQQMTGTNAINYYGKQAPSPKCISPRNGSFPKWFVPEMAPSRNTSFPKCFPPRNASLPEMLPSSKCLPFRNASTDL
jgi:hypothetical protein